jgi:hypothetical protein
VPKVLCEWDCKYNKEGRCTKEEIELKDEIMPGHGSVLDCKTFEWREEE